MVKTESEIRERIKELELKLHENESIRMTNKCFARGCDSYNIDGTCMYGDASKMPCRVNCWDCEHICKKSKGDIACKNFSHLQKNVDIYK